MLMLVLLLSLLLYGFFFCFCDFLVLFFCFPTLLLPLLLFFVLLDTSADAPAPAASVSASLLWFPCRFISCPHYLLPVTSLSRPILYFSGQCSCWCWCYYYCCFCRRYSLVSFSFYFSSLFSASQQPSQPPLPPPALPHSSLVFSFTKTSLLFLSSFFLSPSWWLRWWEDNCLVVIFSYLSFCLLFRILN